MLIGLVSIGSTVQWGSQSPIPVFSLGSWGKELGAGNMAENERGAKYAIKIKRQNNAGAGREN
jgi:hypothetical protein